MKNKTIIPGLVSIASKMSEIKGSYLFRRLNFFDDSNVMLPFHYSIEQSKVFTPAEYDFRQGYYIYSKDIWYYERKIGPIKLWMSYDPNLKLFKYNKWYSIIPFEIGGIMPFGRHIADIINLDLSLSGYIIIRGCAYIQNGRAKAAVMPSFNGKTSKLANKIAEGAEYIAEDILVIDPIKHLVYPTAAIHTNYGRKINGDLNRIATGHILNSPIEITDVDFTYVHQRQNFQPSQTYLDYLVLNSIVYFGNPFIRGVIFINQLSTLLIKNVEQNAHNGIFNFDGDKSEMTANKNHWNTLAGKYSTAWETPAKQIMSSNELKFSTSLNPDENKNLVILDVGIGNGRIIDSHLQKSQNSLIYGMDIAPKMVDYCKDRFADEVRIKSLVVSDLSAEEIPFDIKFDAITAVRVLKYNKNWKDMVAKLADQLNDHGILIFSMTNKNSINRFGKYHIPFERTTTTELNELSAQLGLKVIQMNAFTRIPDVLYHLSTNITYNNLLVHLEKLLASILGNVKFGREIFVKMQKI